MVLRRRAASPGTPLAAVLPIATDVLVLEITPNRPDCLAIYGSPARSTPPPARRWRPRRGRTTAPRSPGSSTRSRSRCSAPSCVPRFTARAFEDVKIGPSPRWLKARLMAAGQRPISNVVDITNYVMLLTGQPLHAFDLDRIAGRQLTVRIAGDGETMETLDGQARTLDSEMVLIADAEGPTSIAGVMGGARSEVQGSTTRVLMEVANWDGANIHKTSLKLGLRSEASSRNEKGLQPEQAMQAQAIATRLMVELCGATVLPGTIDIGGDGPPPRTIALRDARVQRAARDRGPARALGRDPHRARVPDRVGARWPGGHRARVPPRRRHPGGRPDRGGGAAGRARIAAGDAAVAPRGIRTPHRCPASAPRRRRRASRPRGCTRSSGWSFDGPEQAARLRIADRPAVELENPMSADQSRLRTTLIGSLLDVGQRNRARAAARSLRLFEAGAVYVSDPARPRALPAEPYHVAALLSGPVRPATWREPEPSGADFFAAKGALGGMLDTIHVPWTVEADRDAAPFLHPGRSARILIDGTPAGWIGEIHPEVAAAWDWAEPVAALEVDLDVAAAHVRFTAYRDLTSSPRCARTWR